MNKRELNRGEIYKIMFPHTFDPRHPKGKVKFVLILQDGYYFEGFSTTTIFLLTSNDEAAHLDYVVEVETGTTELRKTSYVDCSQPYTLLKSIFYDSRVSCMGELSKEKMNEIDIATYIGLNMGQD